MRKLYCPAEDSSLGFEIQTPRELELAGHIAARLKLPFRVTDTKVFLGRGAPEPRPVAAPKGPSLKDRMKDGDLHCVISGGKAAVFNKQQTKLWAFDARTDGVNGPGAEVQGGDTPPGLYRCGLVTWTRSDEPLATQHAFGPVFVDLEEQQDQERRRGRAGVGIHGGGTGLANPLAPRQGWRVTHGCVRAQNDDAKRFGHLVVTTQQAGCDVWVTVQD